MFLSIVMFGRVAILREGQSLQECVIGNYGIEQVQQSMAYMIYSTALLFGKPVTMCRYPRARTPWSRLFRVESKVDKLEGGGEVGALT
jgi:hypothetical protein